MPAARTPRRNGPYAPLSAFYADDDAVIALEDAGDDLAELLFLRGLAHCAREPRLNGYISAVKVRTGRIIRRPPAKLMKAAARLVEVGLWTPDGDGGWHVKRWTKWNATHDEIVERLARDAARKRPGDMADSARNENGVRDGSAPYYKALQDTTLHVTSEHGSGNRSAAAADGHAELEASLSRVGISVAWDADPWELSTISDAIVRCGVPALVKQAQARYRKDAPAFSVKAFVAGWSTLQPKARPLELAANPCHHGEVQSSKCALCRAEAGAA